MITLSFGFKKPETNDLGDIVFPALEGNIQQLNDHTHDGSDSAKLSTGALTPLSENAASGAWTGPDAGGLYKQTLVLPGALTYDTAGFDVRLDTTGDIVYPAIEKVTSTTYDIFTNDNSVGFDILYI